MPSFDEVVQFVREKTGFPGAINAETTLQDDIGVYGDDMDEFILAYARRFGVEVANYLWYFHSGEEGWGIGEVFFSPPDRRVRQMPITVGALHQFAESKHWSIDYPKRQLPKHRVDLLINQIFAAGLVFVGGFAMWWHFVYRAH